MRLSEDARIAFTFNYINEPTIVQEDLRSLNLMKLATIIPVVGTIFAIIFFYAEDEKPSFLLGLRLSIAILPLFNLILLPIDLVGTAIKATVDGINYLKKRKTAKA